MPEPVSTLSGRRGIGTIRIGFPVAGGGTQI